MAGVELVKVAKRYGKQSVLHPLDLTIPDGSFTVLVGPSGCGKSTLLRLLAGLESLSDGAILMDKVQINDRDPADRDIAMVFQSYALYPHLTVAENLAFHMQVKKVRRDEQQQKIARIAAILGIDKLLQRYPRALSGGQRQRVAMGRAMVRNPQVFLFDEPLSNLDAQLRMELRAEIKSLHQRFKTTMVYCHARSGRSDDAGRSDCGDERGTHRATGRTAGDLRSSGRYLCGAFYWFAAHEPVTGTIADARWRDGRAVSGLVAAAAHAVAGGGAGT
jgi:carbohydrate ABC transporter ATP-binding protein, CUT1 family (TC 3.A.1.1.-)